MKTIDKVSADRLREVALYHPDTGIFYATPARPTSVRPGSILGYLRKDGYWYIRVDGHQYLAHRLAWLYVYGEWPKHLIDHIDGNKSNNRIKNLRDVPKHINQQNIRAPYKSSSTNTLGVIWNKRDKQWYAVITTNKKKRHLGMFKNKEDAVMAYLEAKRESHDGCTI
ncbi:HNH endonuclease signature motif containing protein [Pusillimonas sp. SM2304]|uniref:HNH endonuclease signature motif containing protein n=1 Tax=Pusillimonas sp. SM2304 TaxID=3073241 RepID=UPI0028742725|nr:HNH endonuclease signature motif containing protein [Pusillimonas sp. SM2304]MDS1142431.1 HNH endonuclease signature motif containing protein [Pusillimonas sp. SM2304]